MDSHSVRNMES